MIHNSDGVFFNRLPMILRLSWLLLFCLLLIGCAPSDRSVADSDVSVAEQVQGHRIRLPKRKEPAVTVGQQLPVTAQVELGGEVIKLEVARTPQQQAMGLMYREKLALNRGMLFPLDPPRKPSFWMKNVEIPLDMIFVRDGKISAIAPDVPPCEKAPCPTYGPDMMIDQVIELQGGRAEKLGLEAGDSVLIEYQSKN